MLISQNLVLEQNENHLTSYFIDPMLSPPSLAVSAPSSGHNSIVGSVQGVYPPSDGYFVPGRVQSELSGMNIYSAQPGSSSISSPGNYPSVPGSVGTAPGLMGGHYGTGLDHSPYYGPLGDGYEMKPSVGDIWPGAYGQPPPAYYPYENTFGTQYPYERCYGMDINDGVRRKNATRESTNTLKNWLQEHKKNPYPTKGEKIMLAIITKMTLTQVSTWFANARRRLKKENKMTWVPKNRSNDANNAGGKKVDDDDETGSQHSQDDKSDIAPSMDSDDSDARKVTSTNSNDEAIDQTRLDGSEYQSDNVERISDEVSVLGKTKLSSMPPSEHEQSSFGPFDRNNKSIWSPGNEKNAQHTEKGGNEQTSSIPPSFHSEGKYNASSMNIQRQSSMLSPSSMLGHVDSTRLTNNCNYSPNWSASEYQDAMTSKTVSSSQVKTETPLKEMDMLSHRSSRMTDAKPFASNPIFPINKPQECIPDARSSIIASSYLPGFPDQTQPAGNYRFSDQLGLPQTGGINPSYYSQPDMNLRASLPAPNQSPSYSGNLENFPSKIGSASGIPTASSTPLEQKHQFHQQVPHLSSSTPYYPLEHLSKPATSSVDSSYSSPYYQQESYNQLSSNIQASNVEYYSRKNEQLSGYSGSDGSPFPLPQSSASPRK